jgi:cytochrome c biogenesis factor
MFRVLYFCFVLLYYDLDPEHFWMLTTISAAMIGFALVVYTLSNPFAGVSCAGAGAVSNDSSSSSVSSTTVHGAGAAVNSYGAVAGVTAGSIEGQPVRVR